MEIKETHISGCFVLQPKVFEDGRGAFFESYNQETFERKTGEKPFFVQDNQSTSSYGVLRGLHFQQGEHAQAKLVRVLQGEVLDIAVDIRPESNTFGQVVRTKLSAENHTQLYIPRGCAHGFVTLSQTAIFLYKCDNFYHKASESGIIYNDPEFNIDWLLKEEELIISAKDKLLPTFAEALPNV